MQAEKHKLLLAWARPSEKDEGSTGGSVWERPGNAEGPCLEQPSCGGTGSLLPL